MYNLLSAGFMRLKKNKIFLGMIIISLGLALFMLNFVNSRIEVLFASNIYIVRNVYINICKYICWDRICRWNY